MQVLAEMNMVVLVELKWILQYKFQIFVMEGKLKCKHITFLYNSIQDAEFLGLINLECMAYFLWTPGKDIGHKEKWIWQNILGANSIFLKQWGTVLGSIVTDPEWGLY